MAKRKPARTNKDVVDAFTRLFNEIEPETEEEIDTILREAGLDPDELASRMQVFAEKALVESPLNWRNQVDQLHEEQSRLARLSSSLPLSRQEIIAAIQSLLARIPGDQSARAFAHYRNLEQTTDEDLSSLLDELRYLDAQQHKNDDKS